MNDTNAVAIAQMLKGIENALNRIADKMETPISRTTSTTEGAENIKKTNGLMDYILRECKNAIRSKPHTVMEMDAQTAVNELANYFLGEDWYDCSGATSNIQVNAAIVCKIKEQYKGKKASEGEKRMIVSEGNARRKYEFDKEFNARLLEYLKTADEEAEKLLIQMNKVEVIGTDAALVLIATYIQQKGKLNHG